MPLPLSLRVRKGYLRDVAYCCEQKEKEFVVPLVETENRSSGWGEIVKSSSATSVVRARKPTNQSVFYTAVHRTAAPSKHVGISACQPRCPAGPSFYITSFPSVNRHATRQLRRLILQLVRVGVLLLDVAAVRLEQVVLEALAKVVHADEGVGDGQDDEQDRHDGKGRQRLADGLVVLHVAGLVDAHELEEEVGKPGKKEQNDEAHAKLVLALGEEGGKDEDADGNGDRRESEAELGVRLACDDDEELHREAEEEEEIKLEEGNVNLGRGLVCGPSRHLGGKLTW